MINGDELYTSLNALLEEISTLPVPGLPWLFVWDTIKDVYQDIESSVEGDTTWGDFIIAPGIDLKKVWDVFWEKPFGSLDIDGEYVIDWLSENGLIQDYEEEETE